MIQKIQLFFKKIYLYYTWWALVSMRGDEGNKFFINKYGELHKIEPLWL